MDSNLPALVEIEHDFYGIKFTSRLSQFVWWKVDSHYVGSFYLDGNTVETHLYYLIEQIQKERN